MEGVKQFDGKELGAILKEWKPIWTSPGRIKYQEWIACHNDTLFAYNGYVYVSVPFKCEGTFSFSAPQVHPILEDTFSVISKEKECSIKSGIHTVDFSYPFTLSERVQGFKTIEQSWSTLVPSISDIKFATETTTSPAVDHRYAQIFVDNGKMYSSDGKSISRISTKCIDTVLPNTIPKMISEDIRGITDLQSAVALKSGNYTFLYTYTHNYVDTIKKVIPIPTKKHAVTITDEMKKAFTTSKRTNDEFKQKDLVTSLKFTKGNLNVSVLGRKYKYQCTVPVDTSYVGTIEIAPDMILGLANHFDSFYIEDGYLYAQIESRERFISFK